MVSFDVDIIGEPPPKVQWRFGQKHIDDGDVYNINNVDYNSKFCLPKATRKDTGKYYITATNPSGSDEAEVEITVLGKIFMFISFCTFITLVPKINTFRQEKKCR